MSKKMRRAYELPDNATHSASSSPYHSLSDRRGDKLRGSFTMGFADEKGTPTKKKSSMLLNSQVAINQGARWRQRYRMNETLFKEELQDVKSNIADRWYKLKGMPKDVAVVEYVKVARTWPGFGSSLFMVTNNEAAFGDAALTLGVASDGTTAYKRGSPTVMDHFSYSGMLSFGALSYQQLSVKIEGRGEIIFLTEQVLEIIKLMNAFRKAMVRRKPR